jgi:hypothetical protein
MLDNYCRNCGEKFTETKLEKVINESKKDSTRIGVEK